MWDTLLLLCFSCCSTEGAVRLRAGCWWDQESKQPAARSRGSTVLPVPRAGGTGLPEGCNLGAAVTVV